MLEPSPHRTSSCESATTAESATPRESQRLQQMDDSFRAILMLTGPLVLSSTGFMFMHIFDAIMLSWYSKQAIAVVGAASMSGFVIIGFFTGITSYTATFVAQYMGAQREDRVGAAVWQGIYVGLAAGVLVVALGLLVARPLFHWVGHGAELELLEARYFRIMCYGAPFSLVGAALSGFFSGRGDNRTLMLVQLCGFVCNSLFSYAAIFGHCGLPESGAAGAAFATAVAQGAMAVTLFILYLRPAHLRRFQTWSSRALDWKLTRRMLYFGAFNGLRSITELLAWTIFLFFIGRLGEDAMAITNIVWRLNGIAFFPLIGLSTAIATLVGYMQGSERSDRAERVTWRGVLMAEGWMLFAATLFLLLPRQLLGLFGSGGTSAELAPLIETGVSLLRFVALYCLLDGLNIVFLGALQGAGDTRWTLFASVALHLIFLTTLVLLDSYYRNLYAFWTTATAFVMLQAIVWMARFRTEKWKSMRVIEAEAQPAIVS